MVFAGDYSQMEPVKQESIYNGEDIPEYHHALNCFMELDGKHRFRKDPEWGERLLRFRDGVPTMDDIITINEKCDVSAKSPPAGVQIATYFNKDRDAVNSSIFEQYCEQNKPSDGSLLRSAIIIFMDDLQFQEKALTCAHVHSNTVKRRFYEFTGEAGLECDKGRADPALKLHPNCPLMLTMNADVPNGEANGSRVNLKKVNVKIGEQPFSLKLDCGTIIRAVFASQVDSLDVKHEADDITPPIFKVLPQDFLFYTKFDTGVQKERMRVKAKQLPVISNSCTTGHKLQGCAVENMLANDAEEGISAFLQKRKPDWTDS